jgi:glucose/arabinose dehydrogenase
MFPADYRGAAIVAEHGSWNRSKKSGYRVVAVRLEGAKPLGEIPLVTGFEKDDDVIGRPADVLVMPDGALLVADQLGGAVYRVSYAASGAPPKP